MTSRVERIGDATLYLGDCLEILQNLSGIDACVTDPPYGIKRDRGMGGGGFCGKTGKKRSPSRYSGGWDAERPKAEVFSRILSAADYHIIWGGQFFADVLPASGKWLWWDKQQTMPSYGDGELAWTSLDGDAAKKFTLALNAVIARGETGLHPTQKPVALMDWCLGLLTNARTVCDPFMGSGTTGVACAKRGLRFIGIERDLSYFDIACRRIEEAYKQADLFVPAPKAKPVQEALL